MVWILFGTLVIAWTLITAIVTRRMLRHSTAHEEILQKVSRSDYRRTVTTHRIRQVILVTIIALGWGLLYNIWLVNSNTAGANITSKNHLYILLDTSISMNTKDLDDQSSRIDLSLIHI